MGVLTKDRKFHGGDRWRPVSSSNLYVIPDIHGNLSLLKKLTRRILPLRNSEHAVDRIIFLGDYIDRHAHGHLVLDYLIELKAIYPDQIIFLRGDHEEMFLKECLVLNNPNPEKHREVWLRNGGYQTIAGYLERSGLQESPWQFTRVKDLVPKSHIEFLLSTQLYYQWDDYLFVHAGVDPCKKLDEQDPLTFTWSRKYFQDVKYAMENGEEFESPYIVVGGHNCSDPIWHEKYIMLDFKSPEQLLMLELNSMEAYLAMPKKKKIAKYVMVPHES